MNLQPWADGPRSLMLRVKDAKSEAARDELAAELARAGHAVATLTGKAVSCSSSDDPAEVACEHARRLGRDAKAWQDDPSKQTRAALMKRLSALVDAMGEAAPASPRKVQSPGLRKAAKLLADAAPGAFVDAAALAEAFSRRRSTRATTVVAMLRSRMGLDVESARDAQKYDPTATGSKGYRLRRRSRAK